jgi:hypothetical protein
VTESERYQKRKAYFSEYGKKNRAKRTENQRRWSAANREKVNEYARLWKAKRRAELGLPPAKPRVKKEPVVQAVPKPRIKKGVTPKPHAVFIPRDLDADSLHERFAAYRRNLKSA